MTEITPVDPGAPYGITRIVPEGFHTRTQAANAIGRSKDTLRRWQTKKDFVPTHYMQVGKLKVWLYSDEDMETLRHLAETIKPGRPREKEEG